LPASIRLKRMGRKGRPFYRVVVADTRNPRQGVYIDDIGYYDPMKDPAEIQINEEKALTWLRYGSEPTVTVRSLLSKAGVLKKFHEEKHINKQETDQTNS
jgi:small subunit ribosomal protein S16